MRSEEKARKWGASTMVNTSKLLFFMRVVCNADEVFDLSTHKTLGAIDSASQLLRGNSCAADCHLCRSTKALTARILGVP